MTLVSTSGASFLSAPRVSTPFFLVKERMRLSSACHPQLSVIALVVDSAMRIVQFRGNVAPFLDPEPGEASLDLFRMVRTNLEIPLRSLLAEARKEERQAGKKRVT